MSHLFAFDIRKRPALRALLGFCLLVFLSTTARAVQSAHLMWNASPDTSAAGYILWYGSASHNYTSHLDVGTSLSATISGLTEGQTYYFVVTAYNLAHVQSIPSNEAAFVAPINSPVAAPRVFAISPGSAAPGTQIYIYGTNFTGTTSVQLGGVSAAFTLSSDSLLLATVPSGAGNSGLTIRTPGGTSTSLFTVSPVPAPSNDNFVNAQALSGTVAAASANTTGATKEAGEPSHAGNAGGGSIWYRWTAPYSGTWTLDTAGSDFTTLLAVYTGGSVSGLTLVASKAGTAGLVNSFNFDAVAGTTYSFVVDGPNNARGNAVLRLTPVVSTTTILANYFEPNEGFSTSLPLAGQPGWTGNFGIGSGLVVNNFIGYGQQACIGFLSGALASNPLLVYRPLNNLADTINYPVVHFSVLMQIDNLLGLYSDIYGWSVRNKNGQELFGLSFDSASRMISYNLNNGTGSIGTGVSFSYSTIYALTITMDFSRNRWSANFNGTDVVIEQPMTTTAAALTLGDIDARAILHNLLQPGVDGMIFDNYLLTASPSPAPRILLAPQNQSPAWGSNVVLSAVATGAQPMGCQWYFNNAPISGATNYSLTLKQMTAAQNGNYSIIVTNASGTASSQAVVSIPATQATSRFATGSFLGTARGVLSVSVIPGNNYRFQASTNLVNWTTLSSFFAGSSTVACLDPAAASFNRRFYRVVSP